MTIDNVFTIRVLAIAGAVAIALACATGTRIPDADTPEALTYRRECGGCHALPHPKRNTYAQWEHLMNVMDHARDERGVRPLSAEERTQILAYLKANAR